MAARLGVELELVPLLVAPIIVKVGVVEEGEGMREVGAEEESVDIDANNIGGSRKKRRVQKCAKVRSVSSDFFDRK